VSFPNNLHGANNVAGPSASSFVALGAVEMLGFEAVAADGLPKGARLLQLQRLLRNHTHDGNSGRPKKLDNKLPAAIERRANPVALQRSKLSLLTIGLDPIIINKIVAPLALFESRILRRFNLHSFSAIARPKLIKQPLKISGVN